MLLAVAAFSHAGSIELPESLSVAPAREQIVGLLGTPSIGLDDAIIYDTTVRGVPARALFLLTDGTVDQAVLSIGSLPRTVGQPGRDYGRIAKALRVRYGPATWETPSPGGAIAAAWDVDGAFMVHRIDPESEDHSLSVVWRSARTRFAAQAGRSGDVYAPARLLP